MKRLILALFLFLEAFPVSAFDIVWKDVVFGGGGFVTGIQYHPSEPGLCYARTDMGGAYRWDPANLRWICLTDHLSRGLADDNGILSLAIDPQDADRVYLMCGKYTASWTGTGALLASTDRGNSWTRFPLPVKVGGNENGRGCGERLQVDPNLPSDLWMGTTRDGLWRSGNRGATWTRVMSFAPTNVNFVLCDETSGTPGSPTPRLFAGVADPVNTLYRSDDNGATWSAVPGGPVSLMALRVAKAGGALFLAYANNVGPNGATAGAVYRYDIGTGIFTNISPPTGSYGFSGISVDAQNPNHIVATTLDCWWPRDEVYRSTDGGSTWSPLLATAQWVRTKAPWTAASNPHWLADIRINPFDSNEAMFVTGYGIWLTRNLSASPTTWAFEDMGLEQTVPLEIVSPPAGAPLLSVMGDVDGARHDLLDVSPASGRYPDLRGSTASIDFAEALPSKIVKAFSAQPYGAYSLDGGSTWTGFAAYPAGTTSGGTRAIALSSDGTRIVWDPVGGALSYSANNGVSWTASTGSVPADLCPVADRVHPSKFYAYDPLGGRLWVSTDGGASFAAGAGGLPTLPSWSKSDGLAETVMGREGDVWIVTGAGGLYHSTDSGATAQGVPGVTSAWRIGFGKAAVPGGYPAVYLNGVVGGVEGFFRSDDAGATWERINDDAHRFGYVHAILGDPRTHGRCYLSAEGRGLHYADTVPSPTPTATATRTSTPTATPTPTGTWYTPTHTPVARTFFAEGEAGKPAVFPNPASSSEPSTLVFRLDSPAAEVVVRVFTSVSRKVHERVLKDLPAGEHAIPIPLEGPDGTPLANGVYFVRVDRPEGRTVVKWMVLR